MTTDLTAHGFGLDQTHGSPRRSRIASSLVTLLDRARTAYAEGRRRRRQTRMLRSLSDRMLRDIGLSEVEIADLRANEPFPRMDPGQLRLPQR